MTTTERTLSTFSLEGGLQYDNDTHESLKDFMTEKGKSHRDRDQALEVFVEGLVFFSE